MVVWEGFACFRLLLGSDGKHLHDPFFSTCDQLVRWPIIGRPVSRRVCVKADSIADFPRNPAAMGRKRKESAPVPAASEPNKKPDYKRQNWRQRLHQAE